MKDFLKATCYHAPFWRLNLHMFARGFQKTNRVNVLSVRVGEFIFLGSLMQGQKSMNHSQMFFVFKGFLPLK